MTIRKLLSTALRAALALGLATGASAEYVQIPVKVNVGGTGATTASGARTNLGLGTISTQAASSVAITGGAINGTTVGATTPSTGAFSTLTDTGVTGISTNCAYFDAAGLLHGSGSACVSGSLSSLTSAHVFIGNASNAPTDTAISGDASLANTGALTLASVNSNVGSYGSAWSIPNFTVDAKGRLTAAGATTPVIPSATVTGAMLASGAASTNLSLGSGVATLLGTPSSANLAAALTDETGTGLAVFNNGASLTNPDLNTTGVIGHYADWLTGLGHGNFVTPEQLGAKGDGTTDDTSAWTSAVSVAGSSIYCKPGDVYLISSVIHITANNVHLYGKCVFKAKMGTGGYNSVELSTGRYTTAPLLNWDGVNGGGFEYVEVTQTVAPSTSSPTQSGGDYSMVPVVVRGGMSTEPFVAGTIYCHDITGLPAGCMTWDSIGVAGLKLAQGLLQNVGTDYTGWTCSGVTCPYGSISPTGFSGDGDLVTAGLWSKNIAIGTLGGYNLYLGPDVLALESEQQSFAILAGTGGNTNGGTLGSVFYNGGGQALDIQQSGWNIGRVSCFNVSLCYKLGHGASNNIVGPAWAYNTLVEAVQLYGDSAGAPNTANNQLGPLTGNLVAERSYGTGALQSATSSTAVLASGASSINNYYYAGQVIHMTSGTHSGSECVINNSGTWYNGSTKTVTCGGGWSSGTPTTGDSYTILGGNNRYTIVFGGDGSTGYVNNNSADVGYVASGGLNMGKFYGSLTSGTGNVARDATLTTGLSSQPYTGLTIVPAANATTVTGSGAVVLATAPALTLANATGCSPTTCVSGIGAVGATIGSSQAASGAAVAGATLVNTSGNAGAEVDLNMSTNSSGLTRSAKIAAVYNGGGNDLVSCPQQGGASPVCMARFTEAGGAGHLEFTGTAPTVGSGSSDCGTSPSVAGNDNVMVVTVGSSTNGGVCSLTFHGSWTNPPVCVANDNTSSVALRVNTITTGAIKVSGSIVAGDKLGVRCDGYY